MLSAQCFCTISNMTDLSRRAMQKIRYWCLALAFVAQYFEIAHDLCELCVGVQHAVAAALW